MLQAGDLQKLRISGICERDIDLLLLEELYTSLDFQSWFIGKVLGERKEGVQLIGARNSVMQLIGESDLEVTFLTDEGSVINCLIENKISANLQPQQAVRYQKRGLDYRHRGECDVYYTVLIAPERYFGLSGTMKGFDRRITYESILEWFEQAKVLGDRRNYKLMLLASAIEKGTRGYQLQEDLAVTNFWRMYWHMAKVLAPELQMKEPALKPSRSGFIYFRPTTLPKGVEICHKLHRGIVDLQFRGMGHRLHEMNNWFRDSLTAEMCIKRASKSGVVRIIVPTLETNDSLETQSDRVRAGLEAAVTLLEWFQQNRRLYREQKA